MHEQSSPAQEHTFPTIRALFKDTFALYKERARSLLLFALLIDSLTLFPIAIVAVDRMLPATVPVKTVALATFGVFAILIVIAFWGIVAIIETYNAPAAEHPGALIRRTAKKVPRVGWVALLMTLVQIGGLLILVIPLVVISIWTLFSLYISTLEGPRGMNTLLQSRAYVRGSWWKIFWAFLVLLVAYIAVLSVAHAIDILLLHTTIAPYPLLAIRLVLLALINIATIPFLIGYVFCIYQFARTHPKAVASASREDPRTALVFFAVIGTLALTLLVDTTFASFSLSKDTQRASQTATTTPP